MSYQLTIEPLGATIEVEEGQVVKPGDLLVAIDGKPVPLPVTSKATNPNAPSLPVTKFFNNGKIYNSAWQVIGSGAPITTKKAAGGGSGGGTGGVSVSGQPLAGGYPTVDLRSGVVPNKTITQELNASGVPGVFSYVGSGKSKHLVEVVSGGKSMATPKEWQTTGASGGEKSATSKLDAFLKGASAHTTAFGVDTGGSKMTRDEAARQAAILVDGYLPNGTAAQKAALVKSRVDKWYGSAPATTAAPAAATSTAPIAPTETYKLGRTGIFVYTDPREASGNNTPGVHPVRHIAPGDPGWADAVAKAVDPATLKPLSAKQRAAMLAVK